MLDTATTERVVQSLPEVGIAFYKGVGFGQALADALSVRFQNTGAALKPLSPAHLQAIDIGGGDYVVQWVRRGRQAASWADGVDVPLGEVSESYVVDVLDVAGTVQSTQTVSSATATVTAASGERVRVQQISATIGRGFPAELEIP
jgi:hypothetical protein